MNQYKTVLVFWTHQFDYLSHYRNDCVVVWVVSFHMIKLYRTDNETVIQYAAVHL